MSPARPSPRFLAVTGLLIALMGLAMVRSAGEEAARWGMAVTLLIAGVVCLALSMVTGSSRGSVAGASASGAAGPPARTGKPPDASPPGTSGEASPGPVVRALRIDDPTRRVQGSEFLAPPVGEMTAAFLRWIQQRNPEHPLWPSFDRWVRDILSQFLRAHHVRCLRVRGRERQVTGMDEGREGGTLHPLPGLIEHVLTTGRRYVKGAREQGELITSLAGQWPEGPSDHRPEGFGRPPVWLVPVHHRGQVIGLLCVGELPDEVLRDLPTLQAVAHLLEMYWSHVALIDELEAARRTDADSGVLNRGDLGLAAARIFAQSREEAEPLVLAVLAVEGLRRLDDLGAHADRDWLIRRIGQLVGQRLRSDDLIGRFSDDHFVIVLRRLDLPLGRLIVLRMLAAVRGLIGERPELQPVVRVRAAITDAVAEGYDAALTRAGEALQRARMHEQELAVVSVRPLRPVEAT